jgi:phage FluMu protein Com
MKANEKIFDQRTFDDMEIECPKCHWKGIGADAIVLGFYGIGKFQQISCPKCDEYLGNLSKDSSFGEGGGSKPSR